MKKLIAILMMLVMLTGSALANEVVNLYDVTADGTYQITLTKKTHFYGEGLQDHYKVQQGCATDGKYAYFLLESEVTLKCALFKVDLSDWSIVDVRYDVPVGHGNDMTYNPKTGLLVVVHNKPDYDTISFIDPDTLEIVGQKKLTVNMFSIAYNESRDMYVVGLSGSQNFSFLDSEFNEIEFHPVEHTGYITQGADCDDNYIYFPQWDDKNYANYVIVYDWDGNLVNKIKVKNMNEIESMCHVGDRVIIAFYAAKTVVYEAKVEKVEK